MEKILKVSEKEKKIQNWKFWYYYNWKWSNNKDSKNKLGYLKIV